MTQYAADALGDVVFAQVSMRRYGGNLPTTLLLQLPKESDTVEAGSECGAVESVKVDIDRHTSSS